MLTHWREHERQMAVDVMKAGVAICPCPAGARRNSWLSLQVREASETHTPLSASLSCPAPGDEPTAAMQPWLCFARHTHLNCRLTRLMASVKIEGCRKQLQVGVLRGRMARRMMSDPGNLLSMYWMIAFFLQAAGGEGGRGGRGVDAHCGLRLVALPDPWGAAAAVDCLPAALQPAPRVTVLPPKYPYQQASPLTS